MKTQFLFPVIFAGVLLTGKIHAHHPTTTFTLVPSCQPFGVITPVANVPGCFNFSASNGGVSSPDGYYSWNFGDGTTAVGNPLVHCYTPGPVSQQFTVTVTYNSTLACFPAPMQQKSVLTVAPAAPTGIRNLSALNARVNLFPNPASDQVSVDSDQQVAAVVLSDLTGAERARQQINDGGTIVVSLSDCTKGIYMIKIIFVDGSETNLKLLKQ